MTWVVAVFAAVFLAAALIFVTTALYGAPYVPTLQYELHQSLTELYKISKKDYLVDLGSGDGAVLKAACEHGAKGAYGIEINSFLIWISRWRLRKFKGRAKVVLGNIYTAKLPDETTVVYVFGDSRDIKRIVRNIQRESKRLGRPLYLISNAFTVPGLEPIKNHRTHYLYKIKG